MLRRESDSHDPFLSGEMLADDCVVRFDFILFAKCNFTIRVN